MQRGMIMHQSDIERFAFLFLCGKRDREILLGKEKMTFSDLDRLTYVTDFLGLTRLNLDIWHHYGELFGFGTHMFRHVYGIRLTELHLDDWTIAKLLGHTSVKNVKFYRKMSLQIIADETREIRAEMSRMIRANLAGWGKEYEQI